MEPNSYIWFAFVGAAVGGFLMGFGSCLILTGKPKSHDVRSVYRGEP
jgi:hypothetical protein